jgi:hypothetical protein
MSNSTLTKKAVKKALMGATLVASPVVFGKGPTGEGSAVGSKDQPGVNYLTLDEMPGRNVRVCADKEDANSKSGTNIMPNNMTVVINPFENAYVEIIFTVSEIVANDKAHVLFLVYSPKLSPSPQIPTSTSKIKLKLDLSALEIIGVYNVPALPLLPQMSTRIGAANPAPTSQVKFKVNLDTATVPAMMRAGNNVIHLQAGLLLEEKYNQGDFSSMILSEVDRITFAEECAPEASYTEMDNDHKLTTVLQDDDGGNLMKTSETRQAVDVEVGVDLEVEVIAEEERSTGKTKN